MKPTSHMFEFEMQWLHSPQIDKINIMKYEVDGKVMYNNTNATQNEIYVYIKLRRELSHHIFNTYIPTFCLAMIAGFTLFIDVSHFEATIMVALTSMLVIYTLHQRAQSFTSLIAALLQEITEFFPVSIALNENIGTFYLPNTVPMY